MKKSKIIVICILVAAILLGGGIAIAQATQAPSEKDAFVDNYYVAPIDQDKPFFDEVLPEIEKNIAKNNKHSITPYYDKLPLANNPENFQGLGSTTYANINGKTVTAEAFFRVTNESLSDPNNGMGLLIYQCIQYKRAHPEEDVKITFSSYRTSATAAVCVLPESKYYGYMRSLYGTNYDEHGFVRISYMLTEAARMGIEVTLVNQLNSYAVKQYNPKTKKLESRSPLSYITYYNQALKSDCYNSYAPGKKVSDFMNFVAVGWNVNDKTGDMQHVKSASVSHYLATDGTEHQNTVFFGSANLDDNNYIGANGNNGAQSGVIVSDHEALYRVTYNYMQLMAAYQGQEEMYELRKLVNEMNQEQAALIRAGREHEIPKDEQIIYLGSETDKIFQLYFTPLGSGADSWDVEQDAMCYHWDKLAQSEDYVELFWNEFGYGSDYRGKMTEKMVKKAFCENPNSKNKISLRVTDFDAAAINKLKLGTQIGKRSIKDGKNIHTKDILMSYVDNGVRHNVSILTSCNYYMIAFNYRTNSMLVIDESDETDGRFYEIMAEKYSYNMLKNPLKLNPSSANIGVGKTKTLKATYTGSKKLIWYSSDERIATVVNGKVTGKNPGNAVITVTDGVNQVDCAITVTCCSASKSENASFTGNINEQYIMNSKLSTVPISMEAVFSVRKSQLTGTTTIIGNDGTFDPAISYTLNKSGNPRVAIRDKAGYTQSVYVFDKVNVATGEKVHLTLTMNKSSKKMYCFVNGELQQTITGIKTFSNYEMKHNFVLGGDHISGNATYFPGELDFVALWSDQRVSSEIAVDSKKGVDYSDSKLLAAYNLTQCEKCMVKDLSGNGKTLVHSVLWQDAKDVAPVGDYDYAFAVIGDTQTMCEADPGAMEAVYDWLLDNRESQKISYVIGLGDITDDSTDGEWSNATSFIGKLNGKIPYSLVRGNHDDWDDFNRNLHNGFYETTVDGMFESGDVELTRPVQPGVVNGVTREEDAPEGGIVQGDLTNSYRYFSVGGTDYLIMTLDFAPNEEMLAWADEVIEAHPNHKVIVTTHAYMYRDGTTLDAGDCYPPSYYKGYTNAQNGDQMWEKCFSKHENVVMVLSGHDPWQHIAYRQDKGEKGNTVTQMLIDAQYVDRYIGSTGMVAMFYFSNEGKTLTVRYYSVVKDCYGSPVSQFTIDLY